MVVMDVPLASLQIIKGQRLMAQKIGFLLQCLNLKSNARLKILDQHHLTEPLKLRQASGAP